jgi:siroheme synthase
MNAPQCPDKETLFGYVVGTIAEDAAEAAHGVCFFVIVGLSACATIPTLISIPIHCAFARHDGVW